MENTCLWSDRTRLGSTPTSCPCLQASFCPPVSPLRKIYHPQRRWQRFPERGFSRKAMWFPAPLLTFTPLRARPFSEISIGYRYHEAEAARTPPPHLPSSSRTGVIHRNPVS